MFACAGLNMKLRRATHLPCFNMRQHFNSLMDATTESYKGKDNTKLVTLCWILELWVAQGVAS